MALPPRATELPNPYTADIDVAPTPAMVRLLGLSDALLFAGYGGFPGLHSDECVDALVRAARAVADALRHPAGRVVFSGCGTSGRLSHCMARAMSAHAGVAPGRFDYLLAGTDAALLLPQESVEDRPDAGVTDLEAWEAAQGLCPSDPVVVIGISCGLSATYVGSMLHAAMQRPGYTTVAVGFNPVDAVRGVRVDGWSHSFHDVLQAMLTGPGAHRCVVLNPVLGPETIAGSSRMKGGSGTKVVLETLCSLGVALAHGSLPPPPPPAATPTEVTDDAVAAASSHSWLAHVVRDCFLQYEVAVRHVYSQPSSTAGMAALIEAAARALNTRVPLESQPLPQPPRRLVSPTGRGRVLYVGVGTAGILGLIDASECTPTYGSLFNDVRGFVVGGWATMANKQGAVALPMPRHLRGDAGCPSGSGTEEIALDVGSFVADFGPTLTPADCVVLLYIAEREHGAGGGGDAAAVVEPAVAQLHEALAALELARAAGAATCHALVLPTGPLPPALSHALARVTALAPTGAVVRLPSLGLSLGAPAASPAAPAAAAAPAFLGQLALKLLLNATTTGAHIRTGAIYGNRMVQVMLTNTKLFHRAVGIVADVSGAGVATAERCVIRAIYREDEDPEARVGPTAGAAAAPQGDASGARLRALLDTAVTPVSAHVRAASTQKGIVPLAIMLAQDSASQRGSARLTVAQAAALLAAEPVVRKAMLAVAAAAQLARM